MAHSHHISLEENQQYSLDPKDKKSMMINILVGLVLTVLGIILLANGIGTGEHHDDQAGTHQVAHSNVAEGSHDDHTQSETYSAGATAEQPAADHAGHDDIAGTDEAHNSEDHAAGHGEHHEGPTWVARLWANLWLNIVFFTGIGLIGVFFVAINYTAFAGWSAGFIRIPLALGAFLPIGGVLLLVVWIFGHHDLFHWTHSYLTDPNSPQFDKIINDKTWYLNLPFYLARMVVFVGAWTLFWMMMTNINKKEDLEGNDLSPLRNGYSYEAGLKSAKWYHRMNYVSGFFIFFFAVSSSMAAWDWVMSIDPHWFSTLFGWYTFASWWVSGLATTTLTVILLKERGYLKHVNYNHLHDLGKFMFAFSVFWAYLWFAQFMLIYYANLTEETVYFMERMTYYDGKYSFLFFFNLIINFVVPFLFLMTRDSKRMTLFLKIAASIILVGHWLDFYLMIMPGVTKGTSGFGFLEFGMVLLFAGLFRLIVSTQLTKAPLASKHHPMIEESLHHNI